MQLNTLRATTFMYPSLCPEKSPHQLGRLNVPSPKNSSIALDPELQQDVGGAVGDPSSNLVRRGVTISRALGDYLTIANTAQMRWPRGAALPETQAFLFRASSVSTRPNRRFMCIVFQGTC
jgi:hypothetical protein